MRGHKTWFVQDCSGFSIKNWQTSTVSHREPKEFIYIEDIIIMQKGFTYIVTYESLHKGTLSIVIM